MKNNIITHNKYNGYVGFLGNKMFMYASSVGIAIKNEMQYAFPPHEYLDYFEGDFNVNPEIANLHTKDYTEKNFHYDEVILEKGIDYNLTGYYQSYKYFEHCEDLIRKLFTFKKPIRNKCDEIMKQIRKSNPDRNIISVHFRFGDYLDLKSHHTYLIETDYYKNAIKHFNDTKNAMPINKKGIQIVDIYQNIYMDRTKEFLFLVFSDDKKKACEYMDKLNVDYLCIENLSVPEDMYLQSLCDNNIIANSSFSFWSAWLNANKNKIVIAPDENKWFGIKHKENGYNSKDIVPENWIRL